MSAGLDSTDELYSGRTSPSAFPWLTPAFCPVERGRPSRATTTPPAAPLRDEVAAGSAANEAPEAPALK